MTSGELANLFELILGVLLLIGIQVGFNEYNRTRKAQDRKHEAMMRDLIANAPKETR